MDKTPSLGITEGDIWDDMISDYQERTTLKEGEMTARMLAENKGINVRQAAAILRGEYESGKLERREVRLPGYTYPVKAYREPE